MRELLRIAKDPDVSPRIRVEAWNSIRGWSEHRSKLYGLFAPTKSAVEAISKDAFTADLERMAAELESTNYFAPKIGPWERRLEERQILPEQMVTTE